MNGLFLEAQQRYLATHRELVMTVTCGAVVTVALMVTLLVREARRPRSEISRQARATARRADVAIVPLLLVFVAVVVERFRLLA